MTDTGRDTLDMRDEDRLPWLEAVDDEEMVEGPSSLKLILGVIIALLAIGIIVGGIFWLKNRVEAPQGDASVIPAPASPYKIKPAEPGGMKVEGSGDTAYAASQGADQNSAIDLSAMPETAVTADHSAPAITAKPQPAPIAAAPAPKPAAKPGGGRDSEGSCSSDASCAVGCHKQDPHRSRPRRLLPRPRCR